MQNYRTLIAIHGLRRADPADARKPIAHDEVIALPEGYARNLLASGAVEKTDAEVTVELSWDAPVDLIKSNDRDALVAAIAALGGAVTFPDSPAGKPAGVQTKPARAKAPN